MINPVGVGLPASAAAVRAGINQYQDSAIERTSGDPYKMAIIPDKCLPTLSSDDSDSQSSMMNKTLYRRMVQMGTVALNQACEDAGIDQMTPLFLATPEQRSGRPFPALEPILKDLASEADFPLDLLTSRVFPLGRSAGTNALAEAIEMLQTTSMESAIVGGIDCSMDVMLLSALDKEQRLLGLNTARGFVPGEGAAFVVLSKDKDAGLTVSRPVCAEEPGHIYSDDICLGDGLSSAISSAIDNAGEKIQNVGIQTILCSMNGEAEIGKEWGTSMVRNSDAFDEAFELEHPAECYGDLGAATVPTLLGLAVAGLGKGYYKGPLLVWSASDREQRGAVILSVNKES